MNGYGRKNRMRSLHESLKKIIMTMVIPLLACMICVLGILSIYAYKYYKITYNVNASTKFSIDFKSDIDLKMYHFMVGSKEQKELPIQEVDDAISLAMSLSETTHKKESKEAVENIRNYCYNLKKRMYELQDTKKYESRKIQLENNIYVLTNLIQKRIMDYIYYEAQDMAELEKAMTRNCIITIILAILIVLVVTVIVLKRSFYFSRSITEPVRKLCVNISKVGKGEFDVDRVQSNSYEINSLDEGIQKMARRITLLLMSAKEEQLLQHKTELMLLQAQISPHFLYNTLDTIIWLVEAERSDDAVDMITNLAVFFRTMLSNGDDVITLKDELKHTKSYLSIQQARYRDILEFEIDCPDSLVDYRLPKLTLQPLVENALYHGVKEKRGKSKIVISCRRDEAYLYIVVRDNGSGMEEEELKAVRAALMHKEKKGFGLRAVQERIELYYGEGYGMHIDSVLGEGTEVNIRLPLK